MLNEEAFDNQYEITSSVFKGNNGKVVNVTPKISKKLRLGHIMKIYDARGIKEESWRRSYEDGIMKEESWRRKHGEGIM